MFKVERTYPAPLSLGRKKKYDSPDVHEALQACFFEKCYICETKNPMDINIEHFIPKDEDKDKEFDWDNLYLACSRCNNIKITSFNNLLDCCTQKVWDRIKLLPGFSFKPKAVTIEALYDDTKTIQTAELLKRVYNSDHTISKRLTSAALRSQITRTTQKLIASMNEYHEVDTPDQQKLLLIEKMKMMIKKSSAYSAFCRWIIVDDSELSQILIPYMD